MDANVTAIRCPRWSSDRDAPPEWERLEFDTPLRHEFVQIADRHLFDPMLQCYSQRIRWDEVGVGGGWDRT